jgi:pSer/pThr/pTyr-binding forkhead associated (FHA) protein
MRSTENTYLAMAEENPESPTAYLVRDNALVYKIAPNTALNIGRLDTNDIVLDDHKVSREHAVLKYADGLFTLIDLASTHGTFVEGEGIVRQPVSFGTKIQIVGHELFLTDVIPEALSGAKIITPKVSRTLDRRIKFFGGLNEISLLTLVQFLSQEKQSGLLFLETGSEAGPRIYLKDGEIIHVTGDHGLAELMTRQHHDPSLFFYFHHETYFPERTIRQSTPQFLMELCQRHDQQSLQEVDAAAAARLERKLAPTVKLPDLRDMPEVTPYS